MCGICIIRLYWATYTPLPGFTFSHLEIGCGKKKINIIMIICRILSVCDHILYIQVELDLKRLRDPLQLQLPIQQLTTDKNWWQAWLPSSLISCNRPSFFPLLCAVWYPHSNILSPPLLIISSLSLMWKVLFFLFLPFPDKISCWNLGMPQTENFSHLKDEVEDDDD